MIFKGPFQPKPLYDSMLMLVLARCNCITKKAGVLEPHKYIVTCTVAALVTDEVHIVP